MKQTITWWLWACMYVICVWLGMLGRPGGVGGALYTVASLAFFVPGGLLLYWGLRDGDRKQVKAVRILAAVSLSVTLVTLVLNFVSVLFSQAVGDALYIVLVVVSSPMISSGYWVVSMFLWACLLTASFLKKKNP